MVTFKNIDLDLPSGISKKKKIPVYKAWLKDNGDELKVDVNIDIYSLTPEEAITRVIRNGDVGTDFKNIIMAVVVFKFLKDELYNKPLVDHGDVFTSGQSFSMTIKDKLYELELELYQVVSYDLDYNKDTEEKNITNLVINKL